MAAKVENFQQPGGRKWDPETIRKYPLDETVAVMVGRRKRYMKWSELTPEQQEEYENQMPTGFLRPKISPKKGR